MEKGKIKKVGILKKMSKKKKEGNCQGAEIFGCLELRWARRSIDLKERCLMAWQVVVGIWNSLECFNESLMPREYGHALPFVIDSPVIFVL